MRIFIAIKFKESVIKSISETKNIFTEKRIKGVYVDAGNLHITLHYIGEVNQDLLAKIKAAIFNIKLKKFKIETVGVNAFKKQKRKKLVYLAIKKTVELTNCHETVLNALNQVGFSVDQYNFTPHISLIRNAEVELETLETIAFLPQSILVDEIHIMESKRLNQELVYETIGCVKLN